MDVHVPKVPHSLRELIKEIAIIVVGVLIALFFEELVQSWDWNQKVRSADEAMRAELLIDDGPEIYVNAAIHPCVVSQLDRIRSAVESGKPRGEIMQLIEDFWTPFWTYDSTAYTAAEASQVSFHFDPAQIYPFTQIYASMPIVARTNEAQTRDSASLKAFSRAGGAVSGEEANRVLQALEALRSDDRVFWGEARFALPMLRRVGRLDPKNTHILMAVARQHLGTCVKDLPPDFPADLPPPA
jgi:hypothetical protein